MTDNNLICISIVSPVYKGEKFVFTLVERIHQSVGDLCDKFEIILVEDGSPDHSWEKIEQLCSEFEYVKGIRLSRNFGQHYAITAGLEHTSGRWVVVMDCDLQDLPEEIPNLFKKCQEGFDKEQTLILFQHFVSSMLIDKTSLYTDYFESFFKKRLVIFL